MEKFFLEEPIYSEPEHSVQLVLKNNIVMRNLRRKDRAVEYVGEEVWRHLDTLDRKIVAFMASNAEASRRTLEDHVKKSGGTVTIHLRKLIKMGVVEANGSAHDPGRTYSIVFKDN